MASGGDEEGRRKSGLDRALGGSTVVLPMESCPQWSCGQPERCLPAPRKQGSLSARHSVFQQSSKSREGLGWAPSTRDGGSGHSKPSFNSRTHKVHQQELC